MTFTTVNGEAADSISVSDRGLSYGDGLFETCRLVNGVAPLWEYHARRLVDGLQRLNIACDITTVESCIERSLALYTSAQLGYKVLKVIVTRGVGGRGYGFTQDLNPTIICSLSEMPVLAGETVALPLLQTRLACSAVLAGLKHLNRLENVLLKAECQSLGVDDGLAASEMGWIIETTHSNVFFKFSDGWKTPRLNMSGVAGVMRQLVLDELSTSVGVAIQKADISVAELAGVEAAFCSNSLRGLIAIESIDQRSLPIDDQFQQLQQSLNQSRFNSL